MDEQAPPTSAPGATPGPAPGPDPSAPDPALAALHRDVWQRLRRGVADRRAPARHPVLATQAEAGGGAARVVVLRGADSAAATLEIHTDAASAKMRDLATDPRATLLVWDARARLQIRLRATVLAAPGDAAAWARIPQPARRAYGGHPAPGTPIPAPDAFDPAPDPARFTVLTCTVEQIDALRLDDAMHRRALFRREDGWRGQWLAP